MEKIYIFEFRRAYKVNDRLEVFDDKTFTKKFNSLEKAVEFFTVRFFKNKVFMKGNNLSRKEQYVFERKFSSQITKLLHSNN